MKYLFLFAFIFAANSCDKPTPLPPTPPNMNVDAVIELVNKERSSRGLNTLTKNDVLTKEANRYSGVMASKNTLSHDIEGNFGNRIKRAGYTGRRMGENIAMGYNSAESVVKGWMNSSGHRANILGDYKETGVGVMKSSSKGNLYWTQIFGKP